MTHNFHTTFPIHSLNFIEIQIILFFVKILKSKSASFTDLKRSITAFFYDTQLSYNLPNSLP